MKIGITSYYPDRYGLTDGLLRMKRHGYTCMDYQGFVNTETALFRVSDEEFARLLAEIRRVSEEQDICIYQCHAPWRWPPRDLSPADRSERLEQMKKSLLGTKLLGSRCFVVHPLMPFGTEDNPDEAVFFDINRQFFRELCAYAKILDVTVCLENMPFPALPLSTPAQVIRFVRELGLDNLKVCLDTGHCNVFGIRPGAAVREIGRELLATLHVHDNDGHRDLHWPPYFGTVDWEDFRAALKEIGFDGNLSLETSVPDCFPAEAREQQEIALAAIAAYLAG